jgi:hypothetical protein
MSCIAVGVGTAANVIGSSFYAGVEFEFRAICILESTVTIALETC